ncbi:MAG: potassium transporter TrkG [Chitinophagales bacterium]|nr:potassium transporter TrkG [Chitinophagales bacterium]
MKKKLKTFSLWVDNLRVLIALGSLLTLIYQIGFHVGDFSAPLLKANRIWLILIYASILIDIVIDGIVLRQKVRKAEMLLAAFMSVLLYARWQLLHGNDSTFAQVAGGHILAVYISILGFFFIEFSKITSKLNDIKFSPSLIVAGSFLSMIALGTLLLLLPKATVQGISFTDALFTSASAVCVTGLVTLDTGKDFTQLGQIFILLLIQLGGLGIMTLTGFFGLFFKGKSSVHESLAMRDYLNSLDLGEVRNFLMVVVSFTLSIELIGAVGIYLFMESAPLAGFEERFFFSLFHAVSAFCNAGFSTLTNNFYEEGYRFNYPLQLIAAFLLILGGIGFSIAFNFSASVKHFIVNSFRKIFLGKPFIIKPRLINVNSKLVVLTTILLIVFGAVTFFIFEINNALAAHPTFFGKAVTTFFASVTPRTAGFNTFNYADLTLASVLFCILLMWIGASPGSTGGGIKTSAFAIAVLNAISTARGKNRIEIYHREISNHSVRRAFTIITLSIVVIGASVFLLALFEPEKDFVKLVFESVSAYSTVGLSMGITSDLSMASKYVIIFTMFIGRVGALTLLIGMLRQVTEQDYAYPKEFISMN